MDEWWGLSDMTPEQENRFTLVDELHKLIQRYRVDDLTYWRVMQGELMWLAIADWNGYIDLPLLIKSGLVIDDPRFVHKPDGTWRDHFPTTAYRLTGQGINVLKNYGQFIWTGEVRIQNRE